MRGKAVPQGMRGRRLRETEIAAQQCHLPLHFARAQSPATGSDEKRTLSGQLEGAGGEIIGNRLAHRRQDREQALFASLAGNRQHFAQRSLGASWTGERRLQWVRRKPPGSGSRYWLREIARPHRVRRLGSRAADIWRPVFCKPLRLRARCSEPQTGGEVTRNNFNRHRPRQRGAETQRGGPQSRL
jgi:hypothetical protein